MVSPSLRTKPNMLKRLWHSLNGRIRICLVISILGMTAASLYAFVSTWISVHTEVYRFFYTAEDQLRMRMESYFDEIENIARRVGYSLTVQQYLLSDVPETVIFSYSAAASHIADSSGLAGTYKNIFLRAGNRRYLRANLSYLGEIQTNLENSVFWQKHRIIKPFFAKCATPGNSALVIYYFPVFSILSSRPENVITGALVCGMDPVIDSPFFPGPDAEGTAMLLYDDSIIYSNAVVADSEKAVLDRVEEGQSRIRMDGRQYLTIKISVPSKSLQEDEPSVLRWDYIYYIPETVLVSRVFSRMNRGLFIMGSVVILLIIILALIMRSVNTGIGRMTEDLDTLWYDGAVSGRKPEGNHAMRSRWGMTAAIRQGHLEELEHISRSVSLMLERINNAVFREQEANDRLLEAVTAQARAEFMGYRTQINPHFLFNTLECMRAMAHNGRDTVLETMISSMSRMFRYSIYSKPMLSLKMELEHVENYMKVMNIRSGGKYTLKIEAPPEAAEWLVPSMILQPLAENSIAHGFVEPPHSNCVILIQARPVNGRSLLLRLTDNGSGIKEEELPLLKESLNSGDGIDALHNIYRRMRICFGKDFSFEIKSKQGSYTLVEMLIPGIAELAIPEIK
ncbi:MAG: histidine kinase [Treponema sp.]|jgi:two-component system sensor histidine kinase YesM|nr:histidine kinase [Treponema sp.]